MLSNGALPLVLGTTSSFANCGEVSFENVNGVDHSAFNLRCTNTSQISFEGLVVAGTYRVSVRGDTTKVLLPPSFAVVTERLTVP